MLDAAEVGIHLVVDFLFRRMCLWVVLVHSYNLTICKIGV